MRVRFAKFACLLATSSVVAGFALAPPGTAKTLTPLQKGLDFYKGKTITFISPDAPGGGFDTWSRILAPFLGAALGANVDITNIPPGNTYPGQDTVAAASNEGLTMGWLNTVADVEAIVTNQPALNFNPQHEAFIGATAPNSSGFIASPKGSCAQYTNMSRLIHIPSASNPLTSLDQTSGTSDLELRLFLAAFGIHAQIIPGYANTAALVQGFTRGDGCFLNGSMSAVGPLVKGGQATTIAVDYPPAAGGTYTPYFANVPTATKLAKLYGSASNTRTEKIALKAFLDVVSGNIRILFTPGTVASYKLEALRWAMQKAMESPALQANALAAGDNPGFVAGTTGKQLYLNAIAAMKPAASIL